MYKYTIYKGGAVVKRIAVIPNYVKDENHIYTKKLCDYLSGKAEVVMQKKDEALGICAEFIDGDIYSGVDAVIILGGDGTMLKAAEPCGKNKIPVMGINLGKVGFMTEVEKSDMETACQKLLAGDYSIEERMMMEVLVSGKTYLALNDIVVSKKDAVMIDVELFSNGEEIVKYTADGMIISTPTGSTGYSLSAGGPVADPTMKIFIATPICAHTLSARPMLMAENKEITLKFPKDVGVNVAVDGRIREVLSLGSSVTIKKSEHTLEIIKLGKKSFYHTMMAKL